MMTIRDLASNYTSIECTGQKDLDKVLKIASQKRWHWLGGESAYGYTPGSLRPSDKIAVLFTFNSSNISGICVRPVYKRNKSVSWFVKNFTPKPRLIKKKSTRRTHKKNP